MDVSVDIAPDTPIPIAPEPSGAGHLFGNEAGQQALTTIAEVVSGLGHHAEVLGIRFLSELGQLIKSQGDRS
jgi:hypothetical protein